MEAPSPLYATGSQVGRKEEWDIIIITITIIYYYFFKNGILKQQVKSLTGKATLAVWRNAFEPTTLYARLGTPAKAPNFVKVWSLQRQLSP